MDKRRASLRLVCRRRRCDSWTLSSWGSTSSATSATLKRISSSASSVWVPMKRRGDCTDLSRCRCMLIPDHYHHFGLHVSVVDESVIWNRYTECNRGFMVLNAKDRLRETNSHDLPMRYLIDDRA
ncbi:hypothetical protein Ae201684P_003292 [Aphanomyces euteiches]|nr:hypothetical protein Ae201684P_003292 [Aphanomyces euteiches]